jgi:hypothetical protein
MQMARRRSIHCPPNVVLPFAFSDPMAPSVVHNLAAPKQHLIGTLSRRHPWRDHWRSWVACCVVIALAWPSLGLMPWVGMDLGAHGHVVAHEREDSAAGSSSTAHDHDASEIPGSPTHPADHDCFQCQVLKHLSRCVLPLLDVPTVPLQAGCAVQPGSKVESQLTTRIASIPPARGPPLPSA